MLWRPIPIKLLREGAKVPEYKTHLAAGADLFACVDIFEWINAGERKLIPTGIALSIPEGYVGLIRDKSGNAYKRGITVLAGVIDADYTGEINVLLHNTNKEEGFDKGTVTIHNGDAIAQILFMPVSQATFQIVDELEETDRGAGGFGSTGGDIK